MMIVAAAAAAANKFIFLAMIGTLYVVVDAQECSRVTSKLFASKTAYRNSVRTSNVTGQVTYPGCEPVQVYFLARHGTRKPGSLDISEIINALPKLKNLIADASKAKLGEMCSQDVEFIKNWQINFNESSTYLLADEGRLELSELAKRLRTRFPSLFVQPYSSSSYVFRSTKTHRAEESGKAFAQGLFGSDKSIPMDLNEDDRLLRLYMKCESWVQLSDQYSECESRRFRLLGDAVAMTEDVSRRLGLANALSFDDVWVLYNMCRFDTAWNRRSTSSPWCNMFSVTNLQVIEYVEDLIYYYKDGYGFALNYQLACPMVRDILESFSRSVLEGIKPSGRSPPPPVGLFHFSHSGSLLKLFARLGLFRDEVTLSSSNYGQVRQHRLWRTSLIDPFASNIAFVLFRCANDEYKVATFVQEREVILDNCTTALCPFATFMESYGPIADSCDVDAMCQVHNGSSSMPVIGTSAAVLIFSFAIIVHGFM